MNIAELFVNLGIKGADKTIGALGNVKKGLGEVSSMSLEAKAGILAALYGLEQMAAKSGAAGTGLTNFAALTGLSAKTLQQWEYAARQAGVSGEELTGSLKGVQNSMTNMLLGKGAPEGLGIVSKAVGFDPKKARDTFYVMEQLQKAAQALPKDVGNQVLKSFNLSEGTIAAMRLNKFNPGTFAKAPLYGDKEIDSLNKSNIAWSNLGQKIEMAFGHFNAKHGQSLVGDISKLVPEVIKLAEALVRLSESLHLFEFMGKAFEGWTAIAKGVANTTDEVSKDKKGVGHGVLGKLKDAAYGTYEAYKGMRIEEMEEAEARRAENKRLYGGGGKVGATEHVEIHQSIIHHGDAKDTKAVGDSHKTGVNRAYRQRPAQRKGS